MDQRVNERTAELSQALTQLESEVKIRQSAERQLRHLTVRLMRFQDEERRHIARDLHDAAGQTLAAIKMNLGMLRQSGPHTPEALCLLDDLEALADEALQEIRTTSYLLHPPLLDECGFASAARWFVDGFTKRSGIQVQCDVPERMQRLPDDLELVLFRVLQEALTNVHRHSGATAASVKVDLDATGVSFEVRDNGHGIPEAQLKILREANGIGGVGITGMRERVRQLGGELAIHSDTTGTTVSFALSSGKAFDASGITAA